MNQLTQETLLDGTTVSYTYDKVGNRTSKIVTKNENPTTTNYSYDAGNELTAVNGQAYTYDANGNLTSNGTDTFVYDMENRLIQVKDSNGVTIASFTYDKDGKWTSMTTSSGTTYYHYNAANEVIYETDSNNNVIADYTWDDQGHPVTMTKGGITYYYHINGYGDVTELTDGNGNVVAQYQYDAWGNIISQSGTMASSNPYRYAGYRYDESTGLYYLMARYYDSNVGRFISRDTFNGLVKDSLSSNHYVYVENNPLISIDPSGYFSEFTIKATLAAAAAAYLLPKGYTAAYNLFFNGLYGFGFSSSLLISKLKSSDQLNSLIYTYRYKAWKANQGTFLYLGIGYEFTSGDLYYALQHVTMNVYGVWQGDHWRVWVRVMDTYDFNQLRTPVTNFANAANNLGLLLELSGNLQPFPINVRFYKDYY